MESLMDMVQFKKNIRDPSETESLTAWYNVLSVLFRNTRIELRIGETISESSKNERRENEMAESGTSRNVFGMKIDMLVKADCQDSLQSVELAANEFKRESVSVE
ncbi:hypothetical protein BDC45DRAFT_563706 [Circinella umbellata]|nr:hypothetical protein BDC45DRAFT_563706 [Circinella umbellata]